MFSPQFKNQPPADDMSRRLNRGVEPTPGLSGATGTPIPAQRPPAGPTSKPPELGDFTRMFSAPSGPPSGPGPQAGAGDYTDKLYSSQPPASSGMPPGSGPAAPPPSIGGSEYTRALRRVSFADMKPSAGEPVAPATEPTRTTSLLPVILIGVGLIVILVIILVLYAAMSGI